MPGTGLARAPLVQGAARARHPPGAHRRTAIRDCPPARALADPDLYARDPAGFAARSASLARAEQALAEAEEQWLALEMLREEVEGS